MTAALARNPDRTKSASTQFLRPLFNTYQRIAYIALASIWLAALIYFWSWWLRPEHINGIGAYIVVSLVLAWITLLPLYFVGIFYFAKIPAARSLPNSAKVAMVVTKAPSEPLSIVQRTLQAAISQDYPHDTWLADEAPTHETLAWCKENGVRVSTRQGCDDYQRDLWPRRKRCKEGNLAYFYDHHGYNKYDFVVQLDADHVPAPGYLKQILAPFADPAVGYVSAPSICDNNAAESWSARGRLYVEGMLHGALQAGYNSGWAPLCIGSHYAVRTAALKEIGGLGPELAEDHSTTLFMNAHGWRGVHALDAIAHGDGPKTFADLVTQEFQWSRSLMAILLKYTPGLFANLTARLQFQFAFAQLWYPLFALFILIIFLLPISALAIKEPLVGVTFFDFLAHYLPQTALLILFIAFLHSQGWARPVNSRTISWEGIIFLFARWPWALAGVVAAIRDHFTGSYVEFRVTPKGDGPADLLPMRVFAPYAFLAICSAAPVILIDDARSASGFYFFAAFNAVLYSIVALTILVRHLYENRIRLTGQTNRLAAQVFVALFAVSVSAVAIAARTPVALQSLEYGAERIQLTRVVYGISGAGNSHETYSRI
ncbi:MAG: glycosyltransferase, partial [Paracoccus sp. (in: a-proteobacteria)]|nr:glycosyltransferase [Paracoccus sp. (in: a-proteobacteria)]